MAHLTRDQQKAMFAKGNSRRSSNSIEPIIVTEPTPNRFNVRSHRGTITNLSRSQKNILVRSLKRLKVINRKN